MTARIDLTALGLEPPRTLFIDGAFAAAASRDSFASLDPSTEAELAPVARGGARDIDRAVAGAKAALRGPWREVTPAERGRLIHRLAEIVLARKEQFALIETLDVGKPLRESRGDVEGVAATLRYNGGAADKLEGATIPLGRDIIDFTLLEPVGVTAHIVPWNYPLGMLARSVAPALAAGCSCVVKPAEQSPLSAGLFAQCCIEAGIPPGVVNVVTGYGEEAGAALVAHPDVRAITFTGSVETGRLVYAGAARGLKPAVLELGGKNPLIILPDADLDRAVSDVLDGAFGNSGQVCSASSRLILHRSIHDAFLDRLADAAARLTVGPGMDDRDLGPLVSAEQHQRVAGYIAAGLRGGARLRFGGGRPADLPRGYFLMPTLLDQMEPANIAAREEIFGPVAVALTFDTVEEALGLANGLGYGLVAGVYGSDIGTALRLARDIEAGSVWINGWFIGGQQAPTGGIKDSGVGRERGLPGILNYLAIKNVGIRL
ncbi:aldehyde dehydrogenase family protein [Ancylobacter amanitiformis]|uniref:Acyl-CoA reductase-like NAD-dependent aldehyde dehydrogenase n=1 Tax=Ancylobacter amanitiformis TaxID=217069 RepID=A0ABU0LV18_9HYPH|nr:aldehyde dehydrogenase family protein [Ancylobacter amanitiformis]MDQ0512458.1 acyl-CoA reductase-like NAD-dependent aldehyde dehydrogenase [Ancylobacter amanitiformis]